MSDARKRFVEAIQAVHGINHEELVVEPECVLCGWLLQAADAFADAECLNTDTRGCDLLERNHATCRATLRKEVGLE